MPAYWCQPNGRPVTGFLDRSLVIGRMAKENRSFFVIARSGRISARPCQIFFAVEVLQIARSLVIPKGIKHSSVPDGEPL